MTEYIYLFILFCWKPKNRVTGNVLNLMRQIVGYRIFCETFLSQSGESDCLRAKKWFKVPTTFPYNPAWAIICNFGF